MLDRLFASLINGPGLNCRPNSSRQRIDLTQLAKLKDVSPEEVLRKLLSPDRQARIVAKVQLPRKSRANKKTSIAPPEEVDEDLASPEEETARQEYLDQQTVLTKLRAMAEDARTYENDTGVHVLHIGFPLLSMPPSAGGRFGLSRRIIAPFAMISLGPVQGHP